MHRVPAVVGLLDQLVREALRREVDGPVELVGHVPRRRAVCGLALEMEGLGVVEQREGLGSLRDPRV